MNIILALSTVTLAVQAAASVVALAIAQAPTWRRARIAAVLAATAGLYSFFDILGALFPRTEIAFAWVTSANLAVAAAHVGTWIWFSFSDDDGRWRSVPRNLRWLVGMRSLRRIWPAMAMLGPLTFNVPHEAFVAQIDAILAMDDALRLELADIAVPTLVMVGSQDRLTPLGDSEELASLIPGAELAVVRGGAHVFMVEHAGTFNRTALDFLARVNAAERGHPGQTGLQRQSA